MWTKRGKLGVLLCLPCWCWKVQPRVTEEWYLPADFFECWYLADIRLTYIPASTSYCIHVSFNFRSHDIFWHNRVFWRGRYEALILKAKSAIIQSYSSWLDATSKHSYCQLISPVMAGLRHRGGPEQDFVRALILVNMPEASIIVVFYERHVFVCNECNTAIIASLLTLRGLIWDVLKRCGMLSEV